MARPARPSRRSFGVLYAGALYVLALLVVACTDKASSPTGLRPAVNGQVHREVVDCDSDPESCTCDDPTEASCNNDGGGGDSGDYIDDNDDDSSRCGEKNHNCSEQPLDTTQQRLMDSVYAHTDSVNCWWVKSYISSLGSNANQASSSGFFGTARSNWGPSDKGDTHYSNSTETGADYKARIHIRPSQWIGGLGDLTKTVIHEAAHGYWSAEDPPKGQPYNKPGSAEGFADACYVP